MVCLSNTSNVKALSIDGQEIKFEPIKYEDKVYTINSNEIVFDEDGMATCPIEYTLSYVPKSWSFKPADDSIKISDLKYILMIQAVEGMCIAMPELLEDMEGMYFIRDYDTNSLVITDELLTLYNNMMAEEGIRMGFACCSINEETGEINAFDTVVNVSKIATSKTSIEVKSSEIVLNDDGQTAVFPNSYGVNFAPAAWQIKPKDDNIKVSELSYLLGLVQYNGTQMVQAMPFASLVGEGMYFNLNEEDNSVDASTFLQLYSTAILPHPSCLRDGIFLSNIQIRLLFSLIHCNNLFYSKIISLERFGSIRIWFKENGYCLAIHNSISRPIGYCFQFLVICVFHARYIKSLHLLVQEVVKRFIYSYFKIVF